MASTQIDGATIREILDALDAGEFAVFITDAGALAVSSAGSDDLTSLAIQLRHVAGVLQDHRDPRDEAVYALAREAGQIRADRDAALAAEHLAAGDPWGDTESA